MPLDVTVPRGDDGPDDARLPVAKPKGRAPLKVQTGAIAGALSILLVYALDTYMLPPTNLIPAPVSSALTTVLTFVVSYLTPYAQAE
jgi:hypothetical protein